MKGLKQQTIPTHRMDSQFSQGIEFSYMEITEESVETMMKSHKNVIHRDDYYIFLFLETGSATFTLDFEEVQLAEKSIFYIRPGQIHFPSSIQETKGYFLAIDSVLIENDYKSLFDKQFSTQKSISLEASTLARISETAHLLYSTIQVKSTIFSNNLISNLANAFIGIFAEQYILQQESLEHNKSRSALIAYQFKELLAENFSTIKSPSIYAKLLNYSLSHLNDSVKHITGFPVSYWIHQQVILEAKRLLYYTSLDVKEIAFKLGYDDHTYFSRLFSKTEGISPGAFRNKFRE